MEIGIDSFAVDLPDPESGRRTLPEDRMSALLDEVEIADRAGLDIFGIGEHHRREFLDAAPAVILAAAAARTKNIRLTSAVSVLSAGPRGKTPFKTQLEGRDVMRFVVLSSSN
ncbi:LLM class flavin-dependent oxidoreductase [Cupriavidus basilensis]|nr:LLM class flavin-dependent oxidoreductase [Cupriavidus basilensis]